MSRANDLKLVKLKRLAPPPFVHSFQALLITVFIGVPRKKDVNKTCWRRKGCERTLVNMSLIEKGIKVLDVKICDKTGATIEELPSPADMVVI